MSEHKKEVANPVGWIEVPATDLDRAEKFYSELFGFAFDRQEAKNGMQMSWLPMDQSLYGSAATLITGEWYTPSYDGPTVYFSVAHVGESVEKAESMGAKIIVPKTDTEGHGFFAFIEDSEGNRIAVHSMNG